LILGEAVRDRDVLALDIAGIFEALAECAQQVPDRFGRLVVEKPDHRHRGLLRARRERPRSHAAEQRDELAPFQMIELHSIPASQGVELQDIELAANSQRVSERLYNLLAAGEGGRCPNRVDTVEKRF
jgi:hypothetical protein